MKVSLTPMLKILLFQCILTALIAIPFLKANASEVINGNINSYVFKGESIDIMKELRLSKNVNFQSIDLKIQSPLFVSDIKLVINGTTVTELKVYKNQKAIQLKVDKKINIQTASIESTAMFVEKISVNNYKQNRNRINIRINKSFEANTKINLKDLELGIDDNREIERIKIKTKGNGCISLSQEYITTSNKLTNNTKKIKFRTDKSLSRSVGDIDLEFKKKIKLQRISVELKPLEAPN